MREKGIHAHPALTMCDAFSHCRNPASDLTDAIDIITGSRYLISDSISLGIQPMHRKTQKKKKTLTANCTMQISVAPSTIYNIIVTNLTIAMVSTSLPSTLSSL